MFNGLVIIIKFSQCGSHKSAHDILPDFPEVAKLNVSILYLITVMKRYLLQKISCSVLANPHTYYKHNEKLKIYSQ